MSWRRVPAISLYIRGLYLMGLVRQGLVFFVFVWTAIHLVFHGGQVSAATLYDPTLDWSTFATPRFRVHYPEGARNLAIRIGRIAEEEIDRIEPLFDFRPEGVIEIALIDAADRANGSAQVLPKNIVRLLLAAPTELTGLANYDDWLRILVIHELAHIFDIDQTHGFTRLLRALFGKYIQMNGFSPQFLSEGVAVYAETLLTKTGRGRSSFVEMILRTAALDNNFLSIDRANVQFSDWPGPNAAYYYGGRFHLWLAEKFGKKSIADLHRFYAAMPVPYLYWFGAKSVFGKSLPELWDEWGKEEKGYAEEIYDLVSAKGITKSTQVTFHGRNLVGARYDPKGRFIIYSRSSPVDGATVRQLDVKGVEERDLVLQTYSPRFAFDGAGENFYFSQNAINERFNNFGDLYRYDLKKKQVSLIGDIDNPGKSLRARDPDYDPDGTGLVFVQNELHQSWVARGVFADDSKSKIRVTPLLLPKGDRQYASPRFSPDGKTFAVSVWQEGKRDIFLLNSQDGALVRQITFDEALDGNPAWTPDGRFLLYETDRDGIFNVWAFDLREEKYFQITNVVGGAFQPDVSPDGTKILFRNAAGPGFDIHTMEFEPDRWVERTKEMEFSSTLPSNEFQSGLWRRDEPDIEIRSDEKIYEYEPWGSLLPFNDNWVLFPTVFFRNNELTWQLATLGQDVLAEHTYSVFAGSSWYTQELNWGAFYINDSWFPTVSLGYSRETISFGTESQKRVAKRESTISSSVSWPVKRRHLLAVKYLYERRTPVDDLSARILELGQGENFAWLELGYTYRFTQRRAYSVGDEDGSSLALAGRWYSEAIGANFNELIVTADGRLYINNPLFDNHVLALRGVGALAFGPDFRERFALGGAQGSSFFTVQASQTYPLRGFLQDLQRYPRGIGLFAGYAEYRFPIRHIEGGLWTLPVFIERLHGAVFVEGGNTFGDGSEENLEEVSKEAFQRLRAGRAAAGGEFRVDMKLGWAFPLTVRVGAGLPILDRGLFPSAPVLYYLSFGSAI